MSKVIEGEWHGPLMLVKMHQGPTFKQDQSSAFPYKILECFANGFPTLLGQMDRSQDRM
jgi:hypothetical protein